MIVVLHEQDLGVWRFLLELIHGKVTVTAAHLLCITLKSLLYEVEEATETSGVVDGYQI